MFENIPYRKKLPILLAILLLTGITAYKKSYRITLDAYSSLRTTEEKLAEIRNSQERVSLLTDQVDYLDNVIGKKSTDANIVQQEIMNSYTSMENGSELIKLEEIHKASNDYFNIFTNRLVISGNFNELLKTTYAYEKDFEFSRIVSVMFYVENIPRTRKKKLFEQIIFQNYEKID